MDFDSPDRKEKSGYFLRIALTLFIAFGCAGFYYLFVNMKTWVANNPKKLELFYKNAKRFDAEGKTSFLKSHAGLWVYRLEAVYAGKPFKKTDLLEFKDNGIIWEVTEWTISMPSGSTKKFTQVRQGYIEPYGTMKNDTLANAFTIHQSFIRSGDTCFGGWNFLDLVAICKSGDYLTIAKRSFKKYGGPARDFFPQGLVALTGVGGGSENKFFKKSGTGKVGAVIELTAPVRGIKQNDSANPVANAINIPDCLDMYSLCDVLKKELAQDYSVHAITIESSEEAVAYIQRYYEPFFVYEAFRVFPRAIPHEIRATFTIRDDGSVTDIMVPSYDSKDKMFIADFIREIKSWKMPRCANALQVEYSFAMP